MTSHGHHTYHMVNMSPWPLTASVSEMMLTTGLVKWFHQFKMNLILSFVATILTMIQWWWNVTREGTYQGLYASRVMVGLQWGMILFITSEVLFFFSFFWTFMEAFPPQ